MKRGRKWDDNLITQDECWLYEGIDIQNKCLSGSVCKCSLSLFMSVSFVVQYLLVE